MTTDRHRVVIAGAGIAGLALALRLRQLGETPLVIERQVGVVPQIKGEYFQPQGVDVLGKLGVLESFIEKGAVQIRKVSHQFKVPVSGDIRRLEVSYEARN